MSNRTPSDTSPSILQRVRSRVSGWFSPTSPGNTNGNLRRRRESETSEEEVNEAPPVKKLKSYIVGQTPGLDLSESIRRSHHSSTPTTSTFGTRRNFLNYSTPEPYKFLISSPLHRRPIQQRSQLNEVVAEVDEDDEDVVDEPPIEIQSKISLRETKIPEEEDDEDESIPNGNDTASESGASMSSASVNLRNLPSNTESGLRQSGVINFGSHLQSKKSLFSDKNISMSMSSLNSLSQKRSFNASLYGSTSALSDSRLLNIQSPFYRGRTMFGGASAYSTNNPARSRKFPSTRPSSSLSNFSSSSTSQLGVASTTASAGDEVPLSNTAKRIMEVMNQLSGPLSDVRKMAHSSLTARQRFTEQDMAANRTVRLQTPKTPYSKTPSNPTRMPPMTQLQVPSMSQLLQLKKLQSQTEQLRKCALETTSSRLNRVMEYKLPSNTNESEGSKHINKMRNKITKVRQESASSTADEVPTEVKLPDVQLPQLKSVPKFDITFPTTSGHQQAVTSVSKKNGPAEEKSDNLEYNFSQPIVVATTGNSVYAESLSNNFMFSDPIDVTRKPTFNYAPELAKKRPQQNIVVETVQVSSPPPLKVGSSVLEALKSSAPLKKLEEEKSAPVEIVNSFGSQFKAPANTWECDSCLIRNKETDLKCVACSAAKKGAQNPPRMDSEFQALVKSQSNKWSCSGCMLMNDVAVGKCACCEQERPGALKATTSPKTATKDEGFSKLVSQQKAKWECTACMTHNESGKKRCVCCDQAKPGEATDNVTKFSFNPTPATAKFTFGMPPVAIAAPEVEKKETNTATQGFVFGNTPAPSVPATNESDKTAKEPAKSGFIFGNTSATAVFSATVTTTAEPPKFLFGMPKTTAKSTTTTTDTIKKFDFGAPASTSTVTTATVAVTSATVTSSSNLGGSKFGVSTAAESSVTPKAPATTTFSLGAYPAPVSKASEPPMTTSSIVAGTTSLATTESKPIPSIFGARTPTTTVSTASSKNLFSAPAASPFGSQTNTESNQNLFKSPIAFGETAAKVQPAAPAAAAAEEPKKTLDFGASSQPFTFGAAVTTTSSTSQVPQKPMFTFGSSSAATVAAPEPTKPQQTLIFGGVKPQDEKPAAPAGFQGFGGFGAPSQQQPTQPTFGSFGATTAATATPSPFGQVNNTPAAPPAFGAASTFGSTAPNTNLFGANQSQPSVFGASTTHQPPAAAGSIFGGLASKSPAGASPFGTATTTRGFDTNDGIEPSSKKHGFDFGAPKPLETNSPFTFGANNNNPNPADTKPAFNFSAGAAPNFNFTGSTAQPNSAQPFSFTGTPSPFNFEPGNADSGTNAPAFQFGGTNPFAATPSQQPRRKIRAAVRRVQR
ncbi:Nup153 [Sergentomyia squamirostris]